MAKFSFGSDPEFMIVQNDHLKSAIGLFPHKEHPRKIKGNGFYYDNVLVEVAVKPATTKEDALLNIKNSLKSLAEIINPAKFEIKASANYPASELKIDDAKLAGCNPEWSVYTLSVIEPPERLVDEKNGYFYFKTPFRTAGGHIHLGSTLFKDEFDIFNTIRMMDLFIGIPSIFMDTDSSSKDRRKAYGLAGSNRTPEEGQRLEYRPLSNFWFSSPEHVELIYDLCDFVLDFVAIKGYEKFWSSNFDLEIDDPNFYVCHGYDVKALRKSIDACDRNQASKFMMIVENYLPVELFARIEKLSNQPLPNPYKEWDL